MLVPTFKTFLTGTALLAFYTSVASASPAAVSPNKAGLLRREIPADEMCGAMNWMWRECWPRGGEMAYRDICYSTNLDQFLPVRANCPENSECFNVVDRNEDRTIICVPFPKLGHVDTTTASGSQVGSSGIKEGIITPSMTMEHQMTVGETVYGSISATLLSFDDSFVLTPSSPIIGKIHGKGYTVCKGDASDEIKSMECYPTGLFDFNDGDLVDFTWGMKMAQKGSLKYALSPAVAKK